MIEQFICLSTLAMEVFVFSIWYGVLVNPGYPQTNLGLGVPEQVFLLGAVAFSGYFLSKFPGSQKFSLFFRRLILAGWILLSLLISLKFAFYWQSSFSIIEMLIDTGLSINTNPALDKFFHLIFIAVLALRGIQVRQRSPLDSSSVQQSFQLGIGAILLVGLFSETQIFIANLFSFGGFLLFGLVALSLARLNGSVRLRSGMTFPLNKRWVMAVMLGTLIVTTFALTAGWLGGGWIGVWISRILQWFMVSFFGILSILLYPWFFFIEWLLPLLSDKLTGISAKTPYQQALETVDRIRQQWQDAYDPKVPENTSMIWGTILLLLLIGGGSLLLLKWKTLKQQGSAPVDFESNAGHSSFKLLGNLRKGNLGTGGKKSGFRGILAAARIYQVYAQLLRYCNQASLPKPLAWTPLEFLPKAQDHFPDGEADLALITAAFMKIRYGELPESPDEVQTVVNAWDRIKKIPHKIEGTLSPANPASPKD